MDSPKEKLPIDPRDVTLPPREEGGGADMDDSTSERLRPGIPLRQSSKVTYHPRREEDLRRSNKPSRTAAFHAKRADRFSLFLGIITLVILVSISCYLFYLNNKSYNKKASDTLITTPEVNFYQGNKVFSKKLSESRKDIPDPDDFATEVSINEQMRAMNRKIEKIRALKALEEPDAPLPDKPATPAILKGLQPTDARNFESPKELNQIVPDSMQEQTPATPSAR